MTVVIGPIIALCLGAPSTTSSLESARAAEAVEVAGPWLGDLDVIAERQLLRVLVAFNRTHYFVDGGRQRGLSHDALQEFKKHLNAGRRRRDQIDVMFLPVARDELIPGLLQGIGDVAVANLTITPERRTLVDFSLPLRDDVREIVVTGAGVPELRSADELAGREVWVRASSSFRESLERLNERLTTAGEEPVRIRAADENLEAEDILEMVSAGLLPCTVVDSHIAEFWSGIFDSIRLHPRAVVADADRIAWAFRKESPMLAEAVNGFVAKSRKGTYLGNILLRRYLRNTRWVRAALDDEEVAKFEALAELFRKYAARYRLDWRLMLAQGYQESGLDQSVKSRVGAVGVMQVMPATAADPAIAIADIDTLERNIEAGIKYMRHIEDRYFDGEALEPPNRTLFALAAYNAGPNRIQRLREQAAKEGLDPNVWFNQVELVVAHAVGREPVQYVRNIYKYYIAYQLVAEREARKPRSAER